MENEHKGSEFRDIIEMWEENEKKKEESMATGKAAEDEVPKNDLEQLTKEEASEYDNENKDNMVFDGDRATVNNDENSDASEFKEKFGR